MKKITMNLFKFVLAIIIALAIGFTVGSAGLCRLFKAGCPTPFVPTDTISTQDFVPQAKADRWSHNYDSLWRSMGTGHPVPLHYFTIRTQDLLCAMGIDTAWQYQTTQRYIRLTIGYSDSLQQLKAYIQPVINVDLQSKSNPFPAGKALFFNKEGKIVDSLGNLVDKYGHIVIKSNVGGNNLKDTMTVFVGDLNTPCPSTCGN